MENTLYISLRVFVHWQIKFDFKNSKYKNPCLFSYMCAKKLSWTNERIAAALENYFKKTNNSKVTYIARSTGIPKSSLIRYFDQQKHGNLGNNEQDPQNIDQEQKNVQEQAPVDTFDNALDDDSHQHSVQSSHPSTDGNEDDMSAESNQEDLAKMQFSDAASTNSDGMTEHERANADQQPRANGNLY
jgi:hypothetical protein